MGCHPPRTLDAICRRFRGRRRNFVHELLILEVFGGLGCLHRGGGGRRRLKIQKGTSRSCARASNVLHAAVISIRVDAMARARKCSSSLFPVHPSQQWGTPADLYCICFLALNICRLLFLKALGVGRVGRKEQGVGRLGDRSFGFMWIDERQIHPERCHHFCQRGCPTQGAG